VSEQATDIPEQDAAPGGAVTAKGSSTTSELSRARQGLSRRMAESRATIPDFSLELEVDVEDAAARCAERGVEPLDVIVRAAALALREQPDANASHRDGAVQVHGRVNIAVSAANGAELSFPTIFDADAVGAAEIGSRRAALAARAAEGTITPPELGGATFTVCEASARALAPPIVPPQAAILGVGSVESRPFVQDGSLAVRRTVVLTLVCDHRVLVPAQGAALLERIASLLGQPGSLLP